MSGEQKHIVPPLQVDLISAHGEDAIEYIQVHDANERFIASLFWAEYAHGEDEEKQARADANELARIVNSNPALLARAEAAEAALWRIQIRVIEALPEGELWVADLERALQEIRADCIGTTLAAAGESGVGDE